MMPQTSRPEWLLRPLRPCTANFAAENFPNIQFLDLYTLMKPKSTLSPNPASC